MTIIVKDTFNRTSPSTLGTADTGQSWSTNNTQGISSNQAFVNADYGGVGITNGGLTSYNVTCTFATISGSGEPALLFARMDSTVAVGVTPLASSWVIKGFNLDEGWFQYSSYSATPVNGDIIKVNVASGVAKVYLNGNLIITWTINSHYVGATTVGIRSTSTTNKFDDFIVDDGQSGNVVDAGTFSLTGDTTASPTPNTILGGTASMTGDTNLTANGGVVLFNPTLNISADAVLTATGGFNIDAGTITITGDSNLTANPSAILGSTVSISGDGNTIPDGDINTTTVGASISAQSDLTANGGIIVSNLTQSFTGDTSLSDGSVRLLNTTFNSISGNTTLSSDGEVVSIDVTATLSGQVNLSANGVIVMNSSPVTLSGDSTLTASGNLMVDFLNQIIGKENISGQRDRFITMDGDYLIKLSWDGQREMKININGVKS